MTTEIPAGRPGNLTAEQEEQLRKVWARLFEICGVADAAETNGVEEAAPEPVTVEDRKQSDLNGEKSKKKRLGLFRRGKKDADKSEKSDKSEAQPSITTSTKGDTATPAPTAIPKDGDPNDKYGQTKIFLETLASQSPESIRATIWGMVKHDHPDALVLRFLRARKWDVEKALVMLVSSMNWRAKEAKVDDDIILRGDAGAVQDENGPEGQAQKVGHDFMAQMRQGKSVIHGHDKLGRPICLVRVRLHKAGEQCEESLERYTIYLIETARMLMKPPVDTATIVFDMTGFSMANMDYTPVKFMIKCFEANFPESLGVVLVHKAPWIFQGIWRIIRGWLDPVVAGKINFTNNLKEIQEYIDIDRLPKELEGEEDWEYQYVEPIPGENDKMKDTETRNKLLAEREHLYKDYEEATQRWLRDPHNDTLKKRRNEIAANMRTQYWLLDPYIRARSWYDRIGVLGPGGVLNHYAKGANSSASMSNGTLTPEVMIGEKLPLSNAANEVTSEKGVVEVADGTVQPVSGVA